MEIKIFFVQHYLVLMKVFIGMIIMVLKVLQEELWLQVSKEVEW